MFKFEWDNQKAASNIQKHGVSFDEAVTVFSDEMTLTFADTNHFETEDRSRTYGISYKGRACGGSHRTSQSSSDHQRTKGNSI